MPQFRGIDRDAIVESLQRAAIFIAEIGIQLKETPHKWAFLPALGALKSAEDDAALVAAMRDTHTCEYFQTLSSLFSYYALADKTPDSLYLFHDLAQWGAFDLKTIEPPSAEIAAQIVGHMIKSMDKPDFMDDSLMHQRLKKSLFYHQTNNQALNGIHEKELLDFIFEGQHLPASEIRQKFLDLNRDKQEFLLAVLPAAKGLDYRQVLLDGFSPFQAYCVVVDNVPVENRKEFIQHALDPVKKVISDTLSPYQGKAEILRSWFGPVKKGSDLAGYVFVGTAPAAQALANALPDMRIVTSKGDRIEPLPPGPSRDNTPRPPEPSF